MNEYIPCKRRDPTAQEAIGRVTREERRRREQEAAKRRIEAERREKMDFEKCGRCGRLVPENELEPSDIYGLVCNECFYRHEETEYEQGAEHDKGV